MSNKPSQNALSTWRPTDEQLVVAELLATGHSQNRAAALSGVSQQTISGWWIDNLWSAEFRDLVANMATEFGQRRDQVHDQQVSLAQLIVNQGLTGERSHDDAQLILAIEFLRNTDWKLRAGGHSKFGAS